MKMHQQMHLALLISRILWIIYCSPSRKQVTTISLSQASTFKLFVFLLNYVRTPSVSSVSYIYSYFHRKVQRLDMFNWSVVVLLLLQSFVAT